MTAVWTRSDGTTVEYEGIQEKKERLKKVALALYETCKGAGLSVSEVSAVCRQLEYLASQSRLA